MRKESNIEMVKYRIKCRPKLLLLLFLCLVFVLLFQMQYSLHWGKFTKNTNFKNIGKTNVVVNKSNSLQDNLTKAEPVEVNSENKTLESKNMRKVFARRRFGVEQLFKYPTDYESIIKLMSRLKTKAEIKSNTSRNYFFPFANPLQFYPEINSSNSSRILLVTYFRSGSSFLGDLLQQSGKTFYTFEPLHYMTDGLRITEDRLEEAIHLLNNILNCDFKNIANYINWAKRPENRFLFRWNTFLWRFCAIRQRLCFDADFIRDVCFRSSTRVMKITRLQLRDVIKFIENSTIHDNVQIVYLIRDPRAIYSSRKGMSWCSNTSCGDIKILCSEIEQDFAAYMQMKLKFPERIFLIRYEDLAMNPVKVSKTLFDKLKIPFSPRTQRYLRTHTNVPKGVYDSNPYSTIRDSKLMPLQWTEKLSFQEIVKIQNNCDILQKFGYKMIERPIGKDDNITTVMDTDFQLLK
ncbi:carbohydrate sulfotransferase 3-like protein [Dinothrombium tinctorium]|uniref:Carbohydrate sulfotransferase 3-like protein n=1 Tax=Dinothrombium tinctorium TaxID=1965070 RepID=A0A3S3Q0D0_9ACAR|nr:carbohydrate sulfotransferase 3-like protein [Dinothrombium tinctorium]RWS11518.1 carbohydrate sulfotransferase 3-like protein [Dinothrombium tinctorium]RWS12415.1 carbohydrate sulfotransferase 3-like protein [Dinothrombium tinctorium]